MQTRKLELFIIEKDFDTFVMPESDPRKHDNMFIEDGAWHSRTRTTDIPDEWLDIIDSKGWAAKDEFKSDFENKVQECLETNHYDPNCENYYATYISKQVKE